MIHQSLFLAGYLLLSSSSLITNSAQAAGEQLAVPVVKESSKMKNITQLIKQTELININNASQKELTSLAGIGKLKAARIIAWRKENGSFQSIDDLVKISGIGKKTIKNIAPYITTQ